MGQNRKKVSDGNAASDTSSSDESSVSSDSLKQRRRRKRRRSSEKFSDSQSDYSSSDEDSRKKRKKRKVKHRRHKEKSEKKKKKDRHESKSSSRKPKKHHRKHHHDHDQSEDESQEGDERDPNKATTQAKLQVTMEAREQEKFLIYQNAELARARLNGELREVQAQQAKLQDMYGTIDWRARKKLRLEKKKLERSVAAGKKLAQIEEEETARMDAFRIALGLPTAEAQRQAEWRAEATRALAQEPHSVMASKPPKKAIIGPQLPR